MELAVDGPYAHVFMALSGLVYAAVCSAFMLRTLLEGYAARAPWDLWRVAGLAVCLVWPVLSVILMVIAWRQKRKAAHTPLGIA